jgi:Skp family chaperone for outer membrane proteins
MTKMRALAMAGLFLSTAAMAQPATPPKIVVLDKVAIFQYSKAGQDISRQVQAYADQAKNDLTAQGNALQAEGRTLQQQVAILAPDLKAKRVAAFQAKEQGLQTRAQKKDAQIKAAFYSARQAMEKVLGPILVLDKQAIVMANTSSFDITGEVINRLNQAMPTYKVNLDAPPPPAAAKP